MTWQLAISLSISANVVTNLLRRHYSQRSTIPGTIPPAIAYLCGVAPLGIVVGLALPHHVQWNWWIVFLVVMNCSIMAVANWLGFLSVKRLPVVQYQTISQFYEIVVIALGWIFLDEKLGKYQIIGAVMLLTGAIFAIQAPVKGHQIEHRQTHIQSILLTVAAAIALGTALVFEKAGLGHMDIGAWLIFGFSAQTLAMLVLAAKDMNRAHLREFRAKELKWAAGMGWSNAISGVFFVIAIVQSNNISLITAIMAILLPLTALGAYVILGEREKQWLLWLGLSFGFLGILITSI